MLPSTRALVVRDERTRMCELIRPVLSWDVDRPAPQASPDQLNALMMARTPSQLVEATDLCGPLRRMREDLCVGKRPLLLDADAMRNLIADGTLLEAHADALIDECFLDPFARPIDGGGFSRAGRRPISDARQVIADRGPSSLGDVLGATGGDGVLFEIEPLQDWCLARNLISVAARLAGVQRPAKKLEEDRGTLERAGFTEAGRTGIASILGLQPGACWVIPILYNTWYREGNPVANSLAYPSDLIDPLLRRLTETRTPHVAATSLTTLRGASEVAFLSARGAGVVTDAPVARGKRLPEDLWTYLALLGDDQEALALAYVRALNELLGTAEVSIAGYEADALPVGYRDIPSALWATLMRHEGRYLVTCRMCGRTVLAPRQGPAREFCGDSCRTFSKRRSKVPFLW